MKTTPLPSPCQEECPPLDITAARQEAERCYFCYDAPCITACPTEIDVPLFIRQIATGNRRGAARTIFEDNIFGGICARVCPTDLLCERACVRNQKQDYPVKIGALQRFATDIILQDPAQRVPDAASFFPRATKTNRRIAVIGAGPAGLSCAHHLARYGHSIDVYDAQEKPGGLNRYGIAPYKASDAFCATEIAFLLSIGGIRLHRQKTLGQDIILEALLETYDAIFLAIGLRETVSLPEMIGSNADGIDSALAFIAKIRQPQEYGTPPSLDGADVIIVGGGMTSIDAALQARQLGADSVTILYRGAFAKMPVSPFERAQALEKGIHFVDQAQIIKFETKNGRVSAVEITRICDTAEKRYTLPTSQVFIAIGQQLENTLASLSLQKDHGRIWIDPLHRTSHPKIWAGGDCVPPGANLTVTAVQHGKIAAREIDAALK